MKSIFWLAGEKSGDLHASKVMEQFNAIFPSVNHVGIGGPLMQQQGLKTLFPFEKFAVMGFVEILKDLLFFLKVELEIKKYLKQNKPDLIVLVDYPGLNLRVAQMAYNLNLKIFYYICPQFWAWKHHRVYKLEKFCDFVACILPFEKDLLDIHRINSTYVGHPVTEEISFSLDKNNFAKFFQLDINKKWISFFPGSRESEVRKLIPVYLQTIKKLKITNPDYQFLISKSNSISHSLFMSYFKDNDDIHLVDGYNYEMMKYSDFMIIKSGTTTIEAASIGTPFAIVYIANKLSYMLARKIVKVKYIGLPNIIFEQAVIPELIQEDVNPDKIINTIQFYMQNEKEYNELSKSLSNLRDLLGQKSASKTVSELLLKFISE